MDQKINLRPPYLLIIYHFSSDSKAFYSYSVQRIHLDRTPYQRDTDSDKQQTGKNITYRHYNGSVIQINTLLSVSSLVPAERTSSAVRQLFILARNLAAPERPFISRPTLPAFAIKLFSPLIFTARSNAFLLLQIALPL